MAELNQGGPENSLQKLQAAASVATNLATVAKPKPIGIMIDIETLDVRPRSVITQIALQGYDIEDEEMIGHGFNAFLGIDPQLAFVNPRTISASTLNFWLDNPVAAKNLANCMDDDPNSLRVIMQQFCWEIQSLIGRPGTEYFMIAKGPQFDLVMIETLLADLQLPVPWMHSSVRDLRTLIAASGIDINNVVKDPRHVDHDARWDVDYQIRCHYAVKRAVGG